MSDSATVEGGYVKYPGGVLVHLKDGTVEQRKYGEYVAYDELADYQVQTINRFLDVQPRKPEHAIAASADEANQKVAESNQDFSAVPADYNTLDEAEALGVVRAFNRSPVKQGQVLAYEALHQNRQAVLDGATKKGQAKADEILSAIRGDSGAAPVAPPPVTNPEPVPTPPVEPETGDVPPPVSETEGEGEDPSSE